MKKTIAALGLLVCTNTFALTVDINVNIFQKVLFEKVDSNTLLKIHSSAEVSATGVVQQEGQIANISESQPVKYDRNRDMKLVIKDKHSLQVIDSADGVNQVVTAKIDKKWSGKIKEIKIDKDIYESLYNNQLQQFGGSLFGQFGIQQGNVGFKASLELSDFECGKEFDELVECTQSLTFKISGSDEIVNEQEILANNKKAKNELKNAIEVINSYVGNLNYSTSYDINSYISILNEIKTEISDTERKVSKKEHAKLVSNINDSIQEEILDSYRYQTAKGEYIEQIFEQYLSQLKDIESKL
jgi:hypothetical protein